MTLCNAKGVTCDNKATQHYQLNFMERFSVFQPIVLVFQAETTLFQFSLSRQLFLAKKL